MSRFTLTQLFGGFVALAVFLAVAAEVFLPKQRPAYEFIDTASITQASDTVGIADSDLYLKARDPAAVAKALDEMKSLGVKDLRIVVPWAEIETANGQYDWTAIDNMVSAAQARGMGVLGAVTTTPSWAKAPFTSPYQPPANSADYGDFMSTLASRYAGKISAYEVWNEPNAGFAFSPMPDPAAYTSLLKAAYGAIKTADPTATVIGGVVGSVVTFGNFTLNPVTFVQQMYAAGAAGYFDALSFHPYQYTTPFSQGGPLLESPLNQVTSIYQLMVANGDASKLIWGTEYGLPTSVVGEQNQAQYVSDFLNKWSTLPFAGPAFLYTLVDRNSSDVTDPENTFGVFRDDWTQKLAAQVIKDFIAAHTPPPPTTPPTTDPGQALGNIISQVFQQFIQAILNAIIAALNSAFGGGAPTIAAATPQTAAKAVAVIDGVMADDSATTTDATTVTSTADASTSTAAAAADAAAATESSESTAPESTTPETSTPVTTTPVSTTPESSVPATPSSSVPAPTPPATTTPEASVPASTTPEPTTPATTIPDATVPTTSTPQTAPVPTAGATTTAAATPADTTPAATKSVEPTSDNSAGDSASSTTKDKLVAVG